MKDALYLKIYEDLREKIISGAYVYGEKLPSKRTLAQQNGVSVITAQHAYDLLLGEGYIVSKEKSGYFCEYRRGDKFLSFELQNAVSIKKPQSIKSDFPFSVYAKTVRRVLSEYDAELLNKSENKGVFELRSAIARYLLRSRGIKANDGQIIVGAGAEYLYGLIADLFGRNKVFAIESPSYEQIEKVYKANGITCELLPLSADGIDSAALKESRAKVLHITPYRSFPSGVSASVSKRNEYVDWAKRKGRFIVEDDFESEFITGRKTVDTVFSLSGGERVIYLNTFSKTLSPAVRTAFMVLPESLVKEYDKKLGFYSCTVPVLEQYVLASLLNGGDFERHINRVRRSMKNKLLK